MIFFTDEEWAAFSARVHDPKGWLIHAAKNQARKCVDWVVEEDLGIIARKKTHEEKLNLLKGKSIKSRAERDERSFPV